MLSSGGVDFWSFLVYSPRGTASLSKQSKAYVDAMKRDGFLGGANVIQTMVKRLAERRPVEFAEFFGPEVTVIPVPGSGKMKENAQWLWVPERICNAMREQGLAGDVLPCLRRETAVPKSAGAKRQPPKVHYDSFAADASLIHPKRISLVDDVITRGSTLYAAFYRVLEEFPKASVKVFAMVRTISDGDLEGPSMAEPCTGTITWRGGNSLARVP